MTSTKAFMEKDSPPEDSRWFSQQEEEGLCNEATGGVHRQLASNHSNAPQLVSTSSELVLTGQKLVSTPLFSQEVRKEEGLRNEATGGVHGQETFDRLNAPQLGSTTPEPVLTALEPFSTPPFAQKVQNKECLHNEATGGVHGQETFDRLNAPQLGSTSPKPVLTAPVSSDASAEELSSELPETEEKIDVIYQHTLGKINEKKGGNKLDIEDLGLLKIGSGGSTINKCRYKEKICETVWKFMAAKRMNISCFPDFKTEIKLAGSFSNHENIAGYERHILEDGYVTLYVELCDFTLESLICKNYEEVEESVVKQCPDPKEILRAAVKGIKHLHGHNILHMDIKPSNFMFKEDSPIAGKLRYVLKIIDFGLSKKIVPDRSCASTCDVVGTKCYMSPEHSLKPFKPTKATDMFSLGLLFYYVLTNGKHPFGEDETDIAFNIKHYTEHPTLKALKLDNKEDEVLARDLVLRMIKKLPEDRPTIEEVEIHPYFWDAERKRVFYEVAYDIIKQYENKNDDNLLALLNKLRTNMKIDDLKLPHIPKYQGKRNKQTGELPDMNYNTVQAYVRFVRNTLVHWDDCFEHVKAQNELPKENERRLRMLSYPDILRDLYYFLVKNESFQEEFKRRTPKIDLTKVKSDIRDPKKDGAV